MLKRLFLLMVLFVTITSAFASHFRYGLVTATRLSETSTTVTYRINLSESWRLGAAPSSSFFQISGGNTGSFNIATTTVTDPSGGWSNNTGSTTVTLNKTATATRIEFNSSAKISTNVNNANAAWDEYIILNTNAPGSSPVSTLPAIINMPINATAATYTIPASDPDAGSTLTYGTPNLTSGPLAGQTEPSGFSINATTGQITLNTVGKTVGQTYNAMVTVTDNNGNQIMLDFIIQMVGPSNPPVFDYSVTPANGAVYNVIAGQNLSFPIKATDPDAGSTVGFSVSGLPSYITTSNFSPALPATGNPATTTFSWTPQAAQAGTTNIINIIATDNVGVQTTTSVTIRVVSEPAPVFIDPTPIQSSLRQIVTGVLHKDTIVAQSSLGSNVSIAFATVPSGAILSPTVPTSGANPGQTIVSWTPTPADFGQHNFSYQATITAFPSIFTSRSYAVIANTPPAFSSLPATLNVLPGQFFSYNVTIADADIPYGDTVDIVGVTLPSWLTLTSTGNGTAVLSGTPTAANSGINHVHLEAEDIYHHGNPEEVVQEFDINVNAKPDAGADHLVLCGGLALTDTLRAVSPLTGVWSALGSNLGGATLSTTSNGEAVVTLPIAPFTGTLQFVYTADGGKDTMSVIVGGPNSPIIDIHTGSPVLCSGSTVQLCPLNYGFSNYQWYKDGNVITGATGTSSCITVDATGIGSYTLAGTNGSGCWSNPSAAVAVTSVSSFAKPTITASGSAALCNGGSVILTSSAAAGNLWFKNGNSTGVTTTTFTATEAADYTVLVTNGACTSAVSLPFTVSGRINAGFGVTNATNNCDSTLRFTSTATVGTTSTWLFGDGATATGNIATHKYASIGAFVVKQIVANTGGCTDTSTQNITVYSCGNSTPTCSVTAAFNVVNNTNTGGNYTFISNSTTVNGNMTYFWDFGNGITSTLINPTLSFLTGAYTVKLVVTSSLGCKDSTSQSLAVTVPCTLPVADFTISNSAQCLPFNAFSFSNASTGTNPAYTWTFGDGSLAVVTTAAAHSYASSGTYTVSLVATNGCGSNQVSKTVTINNVPVTPASISGATTIATGANTTLANATVGGTWSSSNTAVATVNSNGVVAGVSAGTAVISYTVSNACGSASSIITVTVSAVVVPCTAPVADFSINTATQCLSGNAFTFTNNSTGTAPAFVWYFGDGGTSTASTATHNYSNANTYTVTLIATNGCGTNQITKTVTVNAVPATPASISGATSIAVGSTSTFSSATAGGVWSTSNAAVATVASNGLVSALTTGTATITYTVTNSCGNATTSLAVTVTPVVPACTAPVANFSINNAAQCLSGNGFTFTNSSTGTSPAYVWNFGDGSATTTSLNASYAYTTANTYTITLTASNACGSHQVTKTVTVATTPVTPSPISGSAAITTGASTSLSIATQGGVWVSSNTAVATVSNAGLVTGVTVGTAIISYTVTNNCGSASASITIAVSAPVAAPAPCNLNANFTINNVSQCVVGNQYVFTNTTTGGTAPFTYLWDLNDGTTATTQNVTKTYAAYGEHDVALKVTDANGCTSYAAAQQIYVGASPKASFTVLNNTGSGLSKTFISSSTIAAGTMAYLWDFGNGTTSTAVNPTVTFVPGTYSVKLIVSGLGTCKDSTIQSITEYVLSSVSVYPNPVMNVVDVSFRAASTSLTTIKITDLQGRVLQTQSVIPSAIGANIAASLDTRGLQNGTYAIYISDVQNGFLASKTILKQ